MEDDNSYQDDDTTVPQDAGITVGRPDELNTPIEYIAHELLKDQLAQASQLYQAELDGLI